VPAQPHGDASCAGIRHHHGDQTWGDAAGATLVVDAHLLGQRVEPPDAGGEDDARLCRIGADLAGILYRQVGCGDAELREPVDLAHLFGAEPLLGVETTYLAPHDRGV
jgi:hypothetical protein